MAEIGRVGPSRREVSGITPSVDPRAFGSGVASALSNMGEQVAGLARVQQSGDEAATTLDQAYKNRQDKLALARLRADMIRMDNEMTRELSERFDAADYGAPGFTDSTNGWALQRTQEFMRNVPEHLRSDFQPQLESIVQEKTNSAFRLQVSAENAEFTKIMGDMQSQAREELLSAVITDVSQLDEIEAVWLDTLTEMMADSPMDAQSTRQLAEQLSVTISSAKMVRLAQEEALDNASAIGSVPGQLKTEGQRVYSDRPVAAGLGRAAVGFLQATSGVESGGDYNVMYSPDGRRYFSDFSKHPNNPTIIASGPHAGKQSTAAGRYQFTKSTWDEVAAELGLTDFSPESQDRAAWHLAQKRYAALTGRDLTAVLESGNQPAIIAAKRLLEPTWEGFKNLSDSEFVNILAGATGNPSSLLYDEEFSHIPLEQRFAILQDGAAMAQQIRSQMAAEAEQQRNMMMEQLRAGLRSGEYGMQEINSLGQQVRFSVDERDKMLKEYQEHQTQKYQAEQMLTSTEDPLFHFDKNKADHKNMASSFFAQTRFGERLAEMDEQYVNELMLPMIANNAGYVPENVAGALTQMAAGQNAQQAAFAMQTLAKIFAESPVGFDESFDNTTTNQVAFFNAAQGSLPMEEILSFIRDERNPMTAERRKVGTEIYNEARRDRPEDFQPERIARDLGARDGIYVGAGQALFSEFYSVYQYQLSALGDHRKARDAALEVLGTRWGETNVGGSNRLMKYPPEQIFGAFDGGFDWIENQVREEFPGIGRFELIADPVTEAQRMAGEAPTYTVVEYDERGLPQPVYLNRHRDWGRFRQASQFEVPRYRPEITTEMQTGLAERVFREEEGRREDQRLLATPTANVEEQRQVEQTLRDRAAERGDVAPTDMGLTGAPLMSTDEGPGMDSGRGLTSAELPPTSAPESSRRPLARPLSTETRMQQAVEPLLPQITQILGSAGSKYVEQLGEAKSSGEFFNILQRLRNEVADMPDTPRRRELLAELTRIQRESF